MGERRKIEYMMIREKIEKLRQCKDLMNEVHNVIDEEAAPVVSDLSLIRDLHCFAMRTFGKTRDSKRAFTFVVLFLYCPIAIAGIKKLDSGIRIKIAEAIGCHPTLVSRMYKNIYYNYIHFRDFRNLIDDMLAVSIDYMNRIQNAKTE